MWCLRARVGEWCVDVRVCIMCVCIMCVCIVCVCVHVWGGSGSGCRLGEPTTLGELGGASRRGLTGWSPAPWGVRPPLRLQASGFRSSGSLLWAGGEPVWAAVRRCWRHGPWPEACPCGRAATAPEDRGPSAAPRGRLPGSQRQLLALVDSWCQLALTLELLPGEPRGLGRQAGATCVAPTRSHPGRRRAGEGRHGRLSLAHSSPCSSFLNPSQQPQGWQRATGHVHMRVCTCVRACVRVRVCDTGHH